MFLCVLGKSEIENIDSDSIIELLVATKTTAAILCCENPLIEAPTQDFNQAYAVKLTSMGEWLIEYVGGEMVPLQDSIIENLCIKRSLSMEIYQWQATLANNITENTAKA